MFHAKLAAMLPMLDLVERNGGDGPVAATMGSIVDFYYHNGFAADRGRCTRYDGPGRPGPAPGRHERQDRRAVQRTAPRRSGVSSVASSLPRTAPSTTTKRTASWCACPWPCKLTPSWRSRIRRLSSSQKGFDELLPTASTRADAMALAACFPGRDTARVVDQSGPANWFTTNQSLVQNTPHLGDAQKHSALADLSGAHAAWRLLVDNPTAVARARRFCCSFVIRPHTPARARGSKLSFHRSRRSASTRPGRAPLRRWRCLKLMMNQVRIGP